MNILILSYYAPPLNEITAQRAFTLACLLARTHNVHLVTRHWSGSESTWDDLLASDERSKSIRIENVSIHYVSYKKPEKKSTKLEQQWNSFQSFKTGIFNPEIDCSQLLPKAKELIIEHRMDYIYTSSPPLNIIYHAERLSNEFKLPLIADFRDLKNDILLARKPPKQNLKSKLEMCLLNVFLKRALSKPLVTTTTVNEEFRTYLAGLGVKNIEVVHNGFEENLLNMKRSIRNKEFAISLIGTVYAQQNLVPLLSGISAFLKEYTSLNIKVKFIGTMTISEVGQKILKLLSDKRVIVTNKMDRNKALKIGKNSEILCYIGWPEHKGIYSGKIFEYLALKKNILIAPKDNGVIDKLLEETGQGQSFNTSEQVFQYLVMTYKRWKIHGPFEYDSDNIYQYSREYQNAKIQRIIEQKTRVH